MTKTSTVRQPGITPPVQSGLLQRQCACGQHTMGSECGECCKQEAGAEAPGIVREVLGSAGDPLNPEIRAYMEPRFGAGFSNLPVQLSSSPGDTLRIGSANDPQEFAADSAADRALNSSSDAGGVDFGHVRIHRGPQAAAAARAVGARAFTVGSHLVFGEGEFQPRSSAGQRLLAHELAHVLQQTGPVIRRRMALDNVAMTPPEPDSYAGARQPAGPDPDDELDSEGKSAADKDRNPIDSPANKAAAKDATAKAMGASGVKPPASAPASTAKPKAPPPPQKGSEPKAIGDLSTGDLALVDIELAEHQRWAAASAKVGAAESKERAGFIAQSAGKPGSFMDSAAQGAKMAAEIKIAEKIIGKVVLKLAVKRLGAQAVKFTPVPGIGAMVGGAISGYELATRDWKATGETIGKFGTGKSQYDEIANDIEAISEVIDVATQVLNVIAGVIGAISFGMWAVSIATVGVASPLAFSLSAIAGAIGLASMILDGINALVLKQLITVFRALDAFTSDADPRDVVAEGDAISKSAGSADSFLGGLAGGAAVDHGLKGLEEKKPGAPPAEHKTPPPLEGEGGFVKGEVPPEGLKPSTGPAALPTQDTPPAEAPQPAKTRATADAPPELSSPKESAAASKQSETAKAAPTAEPAKAPATSKAPATEPAKGIEKPEPKLTKKQQKAAKKAAEKTRKSGPGTPEELFGKGPISGDEVDAMFAPKPEGPPVSIPANIDPETGKALPAKVLEVGAGKVQTDLGLPPEKELVDVTRTDKNIDPQRPDVQFLDATKPPPEHLQGKYDTVIINNPHGYVPDIAEIGKTLKPEGRIIVQGKGNTGKKPPAARQGVTPPKADYNWHFQELADSKAPPGYTREEPQVGPSPDPSNPNTRLKLTQYDMPAKASNAVPEKVMGGPFYFTEGLPQGHLPNSRITFYKEPIAGGVEIKGAPKTPAPAHVIPEPAPKSAAAGSVDAPAQHAMDAPAAREAPNADAKERAKPAPQETPKEKIIEVKGPDSDKPVIPADAAAGGAGKPSEPPSNGSAGELPEKSGNGRPKKTQQENARESASRQSKEDFLKKLVRALHNPDLHDESTSEAMSGLKKSQIEQLKKLPADFDFRKWAKMAADFESTPEERALADVRENQMVDPEIETTPGKKPNVPILAQKGDPRPGRPQNKPPNFESQARKQAKAAFEREIRDAMLNPELHNDRTLATLETLSADEIVRLVEKGKLPSSHDFRHLATVADSPETAHKAESGYSGPHNEHMGMDHAGEPAVPLETMSARDPDFHKTWGWQVGPDGEIISLTKNGWRAAESDASILKGIKSKADRIRAVGETLRTRAEESSQEAKTTRTRLETMPDLAAEAPADPVGPASTDRKSAKERRKVEKALRTAKKDRDRAQNHADRNDRRAAKARDGAAKLEQQADALDRAHDDLKAKVQAAKKGGEKPPPAGSPPPMPSPGVAAQPEPMPEPSPKLEPSQALQPDAPADQTAPQATPQVSANEAGVAPPPAPADLGATNEAASVPESNTKSDPSDPAVVMDAIAAADPSVGSSASPSEDSQIAPPLPPAKTEPAAPPPGLPPLPPPKSLGQPALPAPAQAKSQFQQNMKDFAGVDPRKLTLGESAMFQAMGPAGVVAMRSAIKAHNEPVVKHVNPNYAPPPCSLEQITLIQKDILQALEARAQAEKISDAMTKQQKHHKENEKPIGQMGKATDKQITAAEAHQEAVARRTEANGKMQGQEKAVDGLVDSYPQKADGLDTITGLMRGFSKFTHLGYDLPDWDSLATVKSCIIHMDGDTRRFIHQLDQMDQEMKAQQAAKDGRKGQLESDARLLTDTGQKASDSKDSLQDAKDTTDQLDKDNKARLDEAAKMHQEANGNAQALQNDADQKKKKAESMAAALDEWAQNHRKARLDALKQTQTSLEAQGYKITEVKEL